MTVDEPRPIRVAIVDDDALVRAGLGMLLGGTPDITIVGEAANGAQAEELVDAHWPDIVLMDIRMPTVDGLVATERLRARSNPPHVIVLTTFDADDYVLRALRAGARCMEHGNLLDDETIELLLANDAFLVPTLITYEQLAEVGRTFGMGSASYRKIDDVRDAGACSACRRTRPCDRRDDR